VYTYIFIGMRGELGWDGDEGEGPKRGEGPKGMLGLKGGGARGGGRWKWRGMPQTAKKNVTMANNDFSFVRDSIDPLYLAKIWCVCVYV